jgi:hypothetical protein
MKIWKTHSERNELPVSLWIADDACKLILEKRRLRRREKFCNGVNDSVNHGLQSASTRGAILDEKTAIELFKSQDNTFEFLNRDDVS